MVLFCRKIYKFIRFFLFCDFSMIFKQYEEFHGMSELLDDSSNFDQNPNPNTPIVVYGVLVGDTYGK